MALAVPVEKGISTRASAIVSIAVRRLYGSAASSQLQNLLAQHKDIHGTYMQADGVFLQPTLALLKQKGLLKPAGTAGHISIVSNDGIPQEFDAIRK